MAVAVAVAVAAALAGGCPGTILDAETRGPGGSGGATPLAGDPRDPGPTHLRRLTNREYAATVRDVLGVDVSAIVATFPRDPRSGGFDNAALPQSVTAAHVERYAAAAEHVAREVTSTAERRVATFGCDPATIEREPCLASIVEDAGRKILRRPVAPEQSDALFALAATEPDGGEAAARIVEALLQSPTFLFRVELGEPDPEVDGRLRLTGYEIATRLSYLVWGSAPDGDLLARAATGELDDDAGVERVARAMLEDPRARVGMDELVSQWLRLDRLESIARDAARFPIFTADTARAMGDEVRALFQDFIFTDGADVLDVYTADYGYVNDALASIYGVPAPGTAELVRAPLDAAADRGGLFTTAGMLTLTSRGDETSPIQRGVYILDVVLCAPPPPPPGGVAALEAGPGETTADAEARHTADPVCASCHRGIDPIGHGLERYDAIGALRETYVTGAPVRQDGTILALDGAAFAGGVELGALLRDSPATTECIAKHVFRWGSGRLENGDGADDSPVLDRMTSALAASGGSFRELVVALATSESFTHRRAHTD